MNAPYRLASRLRTGTVLAWALAWTIASIVTLSVVWSELDEGFDSRLREAAQLLLSLATTARGPGGHDAFANLRARTADRDHDEALVYQLRDRDGGLLLLSHEAPDTPMARLKTGFSNSLNWRVYTEVDSRSGLWIHVADRQHHRMEGLRHSLVSLALPLLIGLPLAAWLLGWWLRRTMRPLQVMAAELARRGRGDLSALRTAGLPEELAGVAGSMNDLMARLERALSQEREFSARAAHELRTPLAAAMGQVQLLATQADADTRVRLARVATRLAQLSRTVELLLQWSRAEAGIGFAVSATDVNAVIDAVLADLDPARRHELRRESTGAIAPVFAHVDSLGIVLANLLSNAWRHGGDQVQVVLGIEQTQSNVTISVIDDGAGLPGERIEALGQRHSAPQEGRHAEGLGLGLALSMELARQMGAQLRFESPPNGRERGFAARLTLSRADRSTPAGG